MRPSPRQVAAIVTAAGVAVLLVIVVRPAPVRVDVARAQRGALQVTVDEEGRTRVRDRFVSGDAGMIGSFFVRRRLSATPVGISRSFSFHRTVSG